MAIGVMMVMIVMMMKSFVNEKEDSHQGGHSHDGFHGRNGVAVVAFQHDSIIHVTVGRTEMTPERRQPGLGVTGGGRIIYGSRTLVFRREELPRETEFNP